MKMKLLSALSAIFLAGCAAMSPIPAPQPSWNQATGQIQSSGGTTDVVGEITIRADTENFLAEVTKGPGLPLLRIYAKGAHPREVIIRGALARGGWKGDPANAPEALQGWALLPEVFHWAHAGAKGDGNFVFSKADVNRGARRKGNVIVYFDYKRGGEKIVCHLDR